MKDFGSAEQISVSWELGMGGGWSMVGKSTWVWLLKDDLRNLHVDGAVWCLDY